VVGGGLAGVAVVVGVAIENAYALVLAVGAGFFTAVGAGVLVHVGVSFYVAAGPCEGG
jgi:hypothetical protein